MDKGLLITFEGIDGCGKSTMLKMTEEYLREKGFSVLTTLEPGGSDLGKKFRAMLLDSSYGTIDANTETLLFMADRSRHADHVIKPALLQGQVVLCDRYTDSTIAYQGGGRGLDIEQLQYLNNFAVAGAYPTRTFLFDLSVEQAETRLTGKKDRMEQEDREFFRRVAEAYRRLAAEEPQRVSLIDASADIKTVFGQVKADIDQLLLEQEKCLKGGR